MANDPIDALYAEIEKARGLLPKGARAKANLQRRFGRRASVVAALAQGVEGARAGAERRWKASDYLARRNGPRRYK